MSVLIRIYSKLGKEHIYTFAGYSALNDTLTVYSNVDCDINLQNLKGCVESNQPCCIYITDSGNDMYTTTECNIEGAKLDKGSNEIVYELAKTSFTSHRG